MARQRGAQLVILGRRPTRPFVAPCGRGTAAGSAGERDPTGHLISQLELPQLQNATRLRRSAAGKAAAMTSGAEQVDECRSGNYEWLRWERRSEYMAAAESGSAGFGAAAPRSSTGAEEQHAGLFLTPSCRLRSRKDCRD